MKPPDRPRPSDAAAAGPRERVLAPIRHAREQAEAERAEVAAERRAIETFIDRVESLPTRSRARTGSRTPGTGTGTGTGAGTGTVTVRTDAPDADLAAIRSAYRETVMALDHYEAVYGDDLPESLAAEFGPELAVAIGDGAGGTLTPQLRHALLDAARQSRDDRALFLDTLDGEIESLQTAENALRALLGRLDGEHAPASESKSGAGAGAGSGSGSGSTDGFIDRLETIAAGRQARLNRQPRSRRVDGHDLCSYLYADADWTYPALASVARLRAAVGIEE